MSERGRPAAVELIGAGKRYGEVVAVAEVSLAIEPGQMVTLLGPSGCGKTTTLRMIAGLELATSGRILIDGEDVTRLSASERDVSMVFQSYALFPHLTVKENVGYGLAVQGLPGKEVEARALAGLELVGLAGYAARLPSELSGGQQQRVALARALVLEPKVLLFDEPLSNLDARLRRKMREDIRELQQRLGVTAVYVTHDRDEALSVSDRIVVMDRARIIEDGTPRSLYESPRTAFVARFLGEANLVGGTLSEGDGERAEVSLGGGAVRLELPRRGLAAGPVEVAVRPGAVRVAVEPRPGAFAARVLRSVYLGSHVEYTLDTPAGELFAVGPIDGALAAPGEAWISFDPRGVALVES